MSAQPIVLADQVTKVYGRGDARVVAIEGIDLAIAEGEFLLIRGPSGSGKTSLLHCLSTIATPDSGRVLLEGSDVAELDDDARADRRARMMGFVFQRFNLLPALTAEENVDLPLLMQGWERDRVRTRTQEVLERVGLRERRGAYPDELSGGQLQLVAVARAIAVQPRIVWADEPTGALDTASADVVLDALRAIVDEGTTLVLVSHDPSIVERADRAVTLRDGRIEQS